MGDSRTRCGKRNGEKQQKIHLKPAPWRCLGPVSWLRKAGKDLVWGKELLESSCFITSSFHLVLSEYKLHVIQFFIVFFFPVHYLVTFFFQ